MELKTTLINLFSRICLLMNMAQRFFFFLTKKLSDLFQASPSSRPAWLTLPHRDSNFRDLTQPPEASGGRLLCRKMIHVELIVILALTFTECDDTDTLGWVLCYDLHTLECVQSSNISCKGHHYELLFADDETGDPRREVTCPRPRRE